MAFEMIQEENSYGTDYTGAPRNGTYFAGAE